jgi:SAM-dependent methyltransferase
VFPVEGQIPRLLPEDLMRVRAGAGATDVRSRTYLSFGFEWKSFSVQLPAYEQNFLWYLEPVGDQTLDGRVVLDAGCGMGRHTHHLLARGAQVVALDASPAVEVAFANNASARALFLQADLLHLPLENETFDLACCLGVLHHVDNATRGVQELVRVLRPGGWLVVYLYHDVSETSAARQVLLWLVTQARRVTTRMPLSLLRGVAFGLAVALWVGYVLPCKLLVRVPAISERIRALPLGQYVDYPFRVLWNDQFDRFSAPLERRYRRDSVLGLLRDAGLQDIRILGGYGWRAAGQKPTL